MVWPALVELVHRPDVSRMILELTSGATPIQEADRRSRTPRSSSCSGQRRERQLIDPEGGNHADHDERQ